MLGKCFAIFCSISVIYAIFTDNLRALSDAVFDGAEKAVTLSITLLGIMCLWNGVMELLKSAGVIRIVSRILRPVLAPAFPHAFKNGVADEEITANISANLLGIGNAATPIAVRAMKIMQADSGDDEMTDDMVTLSVLNASSLDLFPTTIIALRRAADSADPYSVIVPIWICSALCSVLAVTLCRLISGAGAHTRRNTRRDTEREEMKAS